MFQLKGMTQTLYDNIIAMGRSVEKALNISIAPLLQNKVDDGLFQLENLEREVNFFHKELDQICLEVLADKTPKHADEYRYILAISKINNDLERMGDHAVNIRHYAEDFQKRKPLMPLFDIPLMTVDVQSMVNESLEAFLNQDMSQSRHVLETEKQLDAHRNKLVGILMEFAQKNRDAAHAAILLILITKNLERIADHATNISEDVLFFLTGQDNRHGAYQSV